MIDHHQLLYALIVVGILIAVPLVAKGSASDSPPEGRLSRVGAWVIEWARPVPELDQAAVDLARVLRRERLRRDVQRLQRILATDMSMSATRQLGNRLAYDWLVRELESIRGFAAPMANDGALDNWNFSPQPIPMTHSMSSQSRRAPNVEILDIRWRG